MAASTTPLVSEAWMASTGPAMVWIRSGGGANIVVLTDEEIAVGVLPPSQLKTAKERLDRGEALINAVGPRACYIYLPAVQSIDAELNGTSVTVEHGRRGEKKKSERLRFAGRDDQAEFLAEVLSRLPATTEMYKTAKSRWSHAVKPLNWLMLLLLVAAGVHAIFALELTDRHATRRKLDEWAGRTDPDEVTYENKLMQRAAQRATARSLAYNPAVLKVLVFGVLAIGVVGLALSCIGYTASMMMVGGAAGVCFFWLVKRLSDPPRSLLLVVPQAR